MSGWKCEFCDNCKKQDDYIVTTNESNEWVTLFFTSKFHNLIIRIILQEIVDNKIVVYKILSILYKDV